METLDTSHPYVCGMTANLFLWYELCMLSDESMRSHFNMVNVFCNLDFAHSFDAINIPTFNYEL